MGVGTKVTNDPAAKNHPVTEGTGLIISDSLAAESQTFKERNSEAGVSKQPSKSTTSNTTDTSAARVLAPAVDAEARQAEEEWNEAKILNAGRQPSSQAKSAGSIGRNGSGTLSGPKTGSKVVKAVGLASGGGGSRNADEDGFDGPNASFGDVDIGGENDPSRVAEQTMFKKNAQFGSGNGSKDRVIAAGEGQFDTLKDTDA